MAPSEVKSTKVAIRFGDIAPVILSCLGTVTRAKQSKGS
jgi:hypothetical protein